jgi:hypothetical protein
VQRPVINNRLLLHARARTTESPSTPNSFLIIPNFLFESLHSRAQSAEYIETQNITQHNQHVFQRAQRPRYQCPDEADAISRKKGMQEPRVPPSSSAIAYGQGAVSIISMFSMKRNTNKTCAQSPALHVSFGRDHVSRHAKVAGFQDEACHEEVSNANGQACSKLTNV